MGCYPTDDFRIQFCQTAGRINEIDISAQRSRGKYFTYSQMCGPKGGRVAGVALVGNLPFRRLAVGRRLQIRRPADCQSATPQVANQRYQQRRPWQIKTMPFTCLH
jgi:hypothetical protein